MRTYFALISFFILGSLSAQTHQISYDYDGNGNRVTRFEVYLRTSQNPEALSETMQNEDAFDEEDGIEAMIDNARFTVYSNPTTAVVRT